jgi:hypothetical protein
LGRFEPLTVQFEITDQTRLLLSPSGSPPSTLARTDICSLVEQSHDEVVLPPTFDEDSLSLTTLLDKGALR